MVSCEQADGRVSCGHPDRDRSAGSRGLGSVVPGDRGRRRRASGRGPAPNTCRPRQPEPGRGPRCALRSSPVAPHEQVAFEDVVELVVRMFVAPGLAARLPLHHRQSLGPSRWRRRNEGMTARAFAPARQRGRGKLPWGHGAVLTVERRCCGSDTPGPTPLERYRPRAVYVSRARPPRRCWSAAWPGSSGPLRRPAARRSRRCGRRPGGRLRGCLRRSG